MAKKNTYVSTIGSKKQTKQTRKTESWTQSVLMVAKYEEVWGAGNGWRCDGVKKYK